MDKIVVFDQSHSLDDFMALVKSTKTPLNGANRMRLVDCATAAQVLRFIGYRIAAEQEKTGTAPTLRNACTQPTPVHNTLPGFAR